MLLNIKISFINMNSGLCHTPQSREKPVSGRESEVKPMVQAAIWRWLDEGS